MGLWERIHRLRREQSDKVDPRGAPIANDIEPREGEVVDESNAEDWRETSNPSDEIGDNQELDLKHRQDLARDKLTRHTQGTEQAETVINRTKSASKWLLGLSVGGAVTIFIIGIFSLPQTRELLNLIFGLSLSEKIGSKLNWHLYLLLFIPTTLMAVLSITLWVTGLKFAAQLYGGANTPRDEESNNGDLTTECVKAIQEAFKQYPGPGS